MLEHIKYNCDKKIADVLFLEIIQLFNSTFISRKNTSSSHMALPSCGGRGGSDFSGKQGKKDQIFLMASDSVMMNYTHCVHMSIELGSRLYVWT
jgi:hypothetical protein